MSLSVVPFISTGSQLAACEERRCEGQRPSHGNRQDPLCSEQLSALPPAEGQPGQQYSVYIEALVSLSTWWLSCIVLVPCPDWEVFPTRLGERKVSGRGRSLSALTWGVRLRQRVSGAGCSNCCSSKQACFIKCSCLPAMQILRQHRNLPEGCSTEAHASQPPDSGHAQSR